MPGSSVLLDTNAYIAWAIEDPGLAMELLPYAKPAITLVSIGELIFGALKSAHPDRNRGDLDRRLQAFRILVADRDTANIYGATCLALRRKGRPIPDNDIWIASLAIQHGLPLLTRDMHFREVGGLDVKNW